MTAQAIEITKDFPDSRERAVLLEMLKIVRALKAEGIEAVICGGWVPFLKELAAHYHSAHKMSMDIDVLLRAKARERESIDRLKYLLAESFDFERSKSTAFRYEKTVDGKLVQLDLLADLPREKEDESVLKFYGSNTSLELCLADGAEDLNDHVETITIACLEGDAVERFEITIPDCVGYLILKTVVCKFRERSKDPYDIYYYCRNSEDANFINGKLREFAAEPAVLKAIASLKKMFSHEDSKWVEMVMDHMEIVDQDERDREARLIARTMKRVVDGLDAP